MEVRSPSVLLTLTSYSNITTQHLEKLVSPLDKGKSGGNTKDLHKCQIYIQHTTNHLLVLLECSKHIYKYLPNPSNMDLSLFSPVTKKIWFIILTQSIGIFY